MALYLGSGDKIKIFLNGSLCRLNLLSAQLIITGIKLLTSDGYILKDSNGLYLITKESE